MSAETDEPWYKDGLQFKCTGCGDCCTGAPGYVWVNKAEIEKFADTLKVSVEEFEKKYVRQVGIRKSLKEFANGDCVFFDNEKRCCKHYEARPRQCKTWPFWDSNLKDEETWDLICKACPGSGEGKLYSLEEIEEQREIMRL